MQRSIILARFWRDYANLALMFGRTILRLFFAGSLLISPVFISPPLMGGHWPNHLNFEVLPVTMSASHRRGVGFGFSIEKLNLDARTITALQGELSFPFMQKTGSKRTDGNGSLALMTALGNTFYIGGKAGASIFLPEGHSGHIALCMRIIPKGDDNYGFFQFVTRQLDLGVMGNNNLYGVVRFGFGLF